MVCCGVPAGPRIVPLRVLLAVLAIVAFGREAFFAVKPHIALLHSCVKLPATYPRNEPCTTSYDACGARYRPPCPPAGCDSKHRALHLPLCPRGGPYTRFVYLVTVRGGGPPNQAPDYGDYEYFNSG